jgi:hypothetical protein
MPSIGSFKAQPLTRTYVISGADGGNGPWAFSQANIDTWFANNADEVTKVSESLYVVTGNFYDVVYSGGIPTIGVPTDRRINLVDMGKQIVIGSADNSRIITLRRVMFPAPSTVGTLGGLVAYVVVENTCSDIPNNDNGRFVVRVSRV